MSYSTLAIGLAFLGGAMAAAIAQPQERPTLDGYRPYAEQPVAPWKQANDAVREAGGWRAYAREAASAASAASAPSAPANPASAATTPASSPHAGHH